MIVNSFEKQVIELACNLGFYPTTLTDKHGYDFTAFILTHEDLIRLAQAIDKQNVKPTKEGDFNG